LSLSIPLHLTCWFIDYFLLPQSFLHRRTNDLATQGSINNLIQFSIIHVSPAI
jgi:hypothetical protein